MGTSLQRFQNDAENPFQKIPQTPISDKQSVSGTLFAITVTFLQHEFVNDIFDHEKQAIYPEDINDNIVFVIKPETKQRPPDKDDVLHVVKEKDPCTVELFKYATHLRSCSDR